MINSNNEWSRLRKVVLGTATDARIPEMDISLRTVNYAHLRDVSEVIAGPYPPQVIDEANEDLEGFARLLRQENVEVLRPSGIPAYYNYCPRDTVLILGSTAVAAPVALRARRDEWYGMRQYLDHVHVIPNHQIDECFDINCVGNQDILALTEMAPKFDAANIIRAGDDLLYLVSNSGNRAGAQYIRDNFSMRVHELSGVYSYMHIDSTVAFLREGLLLVNPSRIRHRDQLPGPFAKWDVIWCPEPIDIGHYPGYCNASIWINMNLFSISEDLVVLEEHQHSLRHALEARGIGCAMLPMRHQRTLGGGFHCVTLDLVRDVV